MNLKDRAVRRATSTVDADRLERAPTRELAADVGELAVHHRRDLGGGERHAGPLEHLVGASADRAGG